METVAASEARDMLQEMIKEAVVNRQQYEVTSEDGSVVMIPKETYNNILVTLELLSTPGLMDQIKLKEVEEEFSKIEEFPHALNH